MAGPEPSRALRRTPTTVGARLGPWVPVALVLASGVALSLFAYAALRERDRTARQADLEGRVAALAARLRETVETPIESANAVAGLFGASNVVERDEFARFVGAALEREPLVHALAWAPRVSGPDRARFEAEARAYGLGGYVIRELDADGRPVQAGERGQYVPLLFIEPVRLVFGFDIASVPERRALLEQACRAVTPVASLPVRLVEDPPQDTAVMVYVPTWMRGSPPADPAAACREVLGYVVLVFRVEPILSAVVRDLPLGNHELSLLDVGPGDPRSARPAEPGEPPAEAPRVQGLLGESAPGAAARIAASPQRAQRSFRFVDRTWELHVAPRHLHSSAWPTIMLALGLLASALAGALAGGANLVAQLRQRVRQATRLGQYVLEEELGRGGMGIVYRAHHVMMRRPTALKLLLTDKPDDQAQFEREVQLTAKLTHPNTIAIYDYGRTADGLFYYVMEYVDGISFADLIEHEGAQPIARTLHLMRQVLLALSEAHAGGLVHRDLTPSNLMISVRGGMADFVKVLDFGLVKEIASDEDQDHKRSRFSGTPGYAAPEVLQGRSTDPRVDVYAVGAIWFALLTGRRAFEGSGAATIFTAQLQGAARPVRDLRSDVPEPLAALVTRCLARDPDERPASVAEILEAVEGLEVAAWTGADANEWWRTHAERVKLGARQQRERVSTSHTGTQRTVVIELRRRGSDGGSSA